MKKISLILAFVIVATFTLSACMPGGTSLKGTTWELTSYGPEASPTAALPDVDATITFQDDGTVTGNLGCNSLTGEYQVSGSKVTMQVASTMMACEEARMTQEGSAFGVLADISEYSIKDKTLTLKGANGEVLIFTQVDTETIDNN